MTTAKKDLIQLLDFTPDEIQDLLRLAGELKANRLTHKSDPVLAGRTGVLIFEKPSLRTRITFETAIHELGGHAINLASDMVQMGKRESVEDVARNLERWVHLIVARTYRHETIEQLSRHSSIPVINALTDRFHPCQALAFALTVKQRMPTDAPCTVVFVGDGNNVSASVMTICAKLGYSFVQACPEGYEPPQELVEACRPIAEANGATISVSHDLKKSVAAAQVVYTDVWTSMGQENESDIRRRDFEAFQVNAELMRHAPDALVSHCLPAHRGEEITSDVLDSPNSMAFDEAENRLHVQKAAIVHQFHNSTGTRL
jgi:ornithine carbamoyltransferase